MAIRQTQDQQNDEIDEESLPQDYVPSEDVLNRISSFMSKNNDNTETEVPLEQPQNNPTQNLINSYGGNKNSNPSDAIAKLLGSQNQDLSNAMGAANNNSLAAILGKAGATIGAGIAKVKPQTEGYEDLIKASNKPVEQVKLQRELEQEGIKTAASKEALKNSMDKESSDSDISKMSRSILEHAAKQAGMKMEIPKNMTAANVEKILPGVEKMASQKMQKDYLTANKKILSDNKNESEIAKMGQKLGEDLDTNRFRAGEAGKNQARVNAAGRVETLLNQFPDGNIPKIQTRELATSVAGLLTNGNQTSVSQINELVPDSAKGKAADIASWFTNEPTGQQQQKFIKLFEDTAKREKETAQKQILDAQLKKAYGTHSAYKKKDPEGFYRTLSVYTGIDPEELQAMEKNPKLREGLLSNKKEPSSNLTGEDKISKFMKDNSIQDRNEAIKILKDNGKL